MNFFHTVIFDLDGTLSDSSILTMAALKYAAPIHGLPIPSEDDVRRATGYPNPEFYYLLYPDFPRHTVYSMGQLVEQEEQKILSSVKDRLLFNGCSRLLTQLREKGISLCIASTGDREHVFSILKETGIIELFDTISCGSPDKTEMLREMILNGGKSGPFIMVGDMKKDYEAARMNNILSVGACYGYCRREETDFDFYIDEPLQLLHILENSGR
jgi:phosphoglycolate phosphatase